MKYDKDLVSIKGQETYIFTPENAKLVLADEELMEELKLPDVFIKQFQRNIDIAEQHFNNHLFPTLFFYKGRWFIGLCLYIDKGYTDVKYHDSWFCRKCFSTLADKVLIPEEENGMFFPKRWEERYPSFFHFMRCPNCGQRTDRDLLTEEEFQMMIER